MSRTKRFKKAPKPPGEIDKKGAIYSKTGARKRKKHESDEKFKRFLKKHNSDY